MNKKVLYIGGSPCCGKSTVAERLAKELGATYYQVDHYLDEFMEQVADRGAPVCSKAVKMKGDEIWLRDPEIQCEEEFKIYSEVAGRVFDRLHKIRSEFVIAEGAAFTPAVMTKSGFADYICMIPTPEFQIARYRERSWVPYVVMDCSDKERAFDNWMRRDILFAQRIRQECDEKGIPCLITDGSRSEDDTFAAVKELFGL